jgi:prephenate dehydrogenase
MFEKVVIVGVGLIGGSFALGLKAAHAARTIVGWNVRSEALKRALELGIVDETATDPRQALAGADLVLLAAPVAQTGAILAALLPHLETAHHRHRRRQHQVRRGGGGARRDERAHLPVRAGPPDRRTRTNGPDAAIPDLYRGKKVVLTPLPENAGSTWRAWPMPGAAAAPSSICCRPRSTTGCSPR